MVFSVLFAFMVSASPPKCLTYYFKCLSFSQPHGAGPSAGLLPKMRLEALDPLCCRCYPGLGPHHSGLLLLRAPSPCLQEGLAHHHSLCLLMHLDHLVLVLLGYLLVIQESRAPCSSCSQSGQQGGVLPEHNTQLYDVYILPVRSVPPQDALNVLKSLGVKLY